MIADDKPGTQPVRLPDANCSIPFLPAGAVIERIGFVSSGVADQAVLFELPAPIQRRAVLVKGVTENSSPDSAHELLVLTLPTQLGEANAETQTEVLSQFRTWADAATPADSPTCLPQQSLLLTLQNTQVFWNPGRVAILALPDRLETVRKALVEVSYYEGELRDIERTLGQTWPQLEADTPLAFEFEERAIGQRKQLRRRFQQVLLLRARLARISPYVLCPHLHPPTLASQTAERLRERTQMTHRLECVEAQLEVFERVYEMCGERASNFMLTRSGNTLEWAIIVLLLTQLLLAGFELLTRVGQ